MKNKYLLICLTFLTISPTYGMNSIRNPAHPISPLNPMNNSSKNNYSLPTSEEDMQKIYEKLKKSKERLRILNEHTNKQDKLLRQYDCSALMVQFSHLKGFHKEMNERLQGSLRHYMSSHIEEEWMINRQIASLICFGSNPNIVAGRTSSGREYIFPLEVAVETDDEPLVSLLLDHGAKTNIDSMRWWKDVRYKYLKSFGLSSNYKERPLAFKIRSVEVAKLLVPHIDMQARDKKGNTVLHNHVHRSLVDDDLSKYYIENNTDLVNTVNKAGNLPLHVAAYQCNEHTAQLLIPKTDNINALNNEIKTPFDLAIQKQKRSKYPYLCNGIIALFKEYGAKSSFDAE